MTDNKHASTTRLLFPEDQNLIILRAEFTIARSPTYSYLPSNTQHATLKIASRLKRQHQNRVKIKEACIRHLLILQHDLDRRRNDRATAVCTDYYLLLPLLCPAQNVRSCKTYPILVASSFGPQKMGALMKGFRLNPLSACKKYPTLTPSSLCPKTWMGASS